MLRHNNNNKKVALITRHRARGAMLAVLLGSGMSAHAATQQEQATGFFDGSHLDLLNRNYYFNRDYRNGATNNVAANARKPVSDRNGYREDWAQGLTAMFSSGWTQGTVGFGIDAFAMFGLKLNGGGGTTGTSLVPWSTSGHPETDYSRMGGALKVQFSNTVLKLGEQQPRVPVITVNETRLVPSTARGISINSNEVPRLNFQAGHFTATTSNDSTNSDGEITTDYEVLPAARSLDYVGGTYKFTDYLSGMLYGSELKDIWRQYYGNLTYQLPLPKDQALTLAFNAYNTYDYGASLGGPIDNFAWSALAAYRTGGHKITVAYQMIDGDEPFDFIAFDRTQSGVPYLSNVGSVFAFQEPNERSWQLRYDLDFAAYGVPGLTLMTRYIRGEGMDNSNSKNAFYNRVVHYDPVADNNKEWERDIDIGYVVQSGKAKDLSIRLRNGVHRSSSGTRWPDFDEYRVVIDYPIRIF